MGTALVTLLLFALLPIGVRGQAFHNYLVEQTARVFRRHGFEVATEHPLPLPDGRVDCVDIVAWRRAIVLLCEVETSARNVGTNAEKAAALYLPLWVVVPNEAVRTAVRAKLANTGHAPGGRPISFFLLGELGPALTDCLPFSSAANPLEGKGKTKRKDKKSNGSALKGRVANGSRPRRRKERSSWKSNGPMRSSSFWPSSG